MEDLPFDILRDILQYLSLCRIVEVSMLSRTMNGNVASSVNVYTSQGRSWWVEKLARYFPKYPLDTFVSGLPENFFAEQGDCLLNPAEIYVIHDMSVVTAAKFGVQKSSCVLKYLRLKNYNRMSVEEMEELAKMGQKEIIWREFIGNEGNLWTTASLLIESNNMRAAKAIIQHPKIDSEHLFRITQAILQLNPLTGEALNVFEEVLDHPKYDLSLYHYAILRDAVGRRNIEAAREVLKRMKIDKTGKKIGIDSDSGYALRHAVNNGDVDIVQLLLENGADPHTHRDKPFSEALWKKRVDIIRLLIASPRFERAVLNKIPNLYMYSSKADREYLELLRKQGKFVLRTEMWQYQK